MAPLTARPGMTRTRSVRARRAGPDQIPDNHRFAKRLVGRLSESTWASLAYSRIGNRQRNRNSPFFPVPPPLPGYASFPTPHTQQVVHGGLGSKEEAMLEWLGVVRMADVDAVRWALAGLQEGEPDGPVSVRRANPWVARLAGVRLVGRARPMYRDRQILWPTHWATGRSAPILFRQTMRHELAVAAVFARYLARGDSWTRDRRPRSMMDHQSDGVATKSGSIDLIEVELTVKKIARYKMIHAAHSARLAQGVSRIVYVCTDEVARAIDREADKFLFRDDRSKLVTLPALDGQGRWIASIAELWEGTHSKK